MPQGSGSFWPLVIFLVLIFGMLYFLMIRPMRQRERRHDEVVAGLQIGDRVITAGGVYGEIDSIDEDSVILKVESGAKIRVIKGGIARRLEG